MAVDRVREALALEHLRLTGAIEDINREYEKRMTEVVADHTTRRLAHSGQHAKAICTTQIGRVKAIINKQLELRQETLASLPEAANDESFSALALDLERTVDNVVRSIPTHVSRHTGGTASTVPAGALANEFEPEAFSLKAFARRQVEIMRREFQLREHSPVPDLERPVEQLERDARKVFVVHGRNEPARKAMFEFLRAIGLEPLEWNEAVALARDGAPYVGEILDRAFAEVQAVVVLLTGDDLAHLRRKFVNVDDPPHETGPTPQARPNVLFEAGMAFGRHPERTVLVTLGYTRPFSDVAGRHSIKISNAVAHRQALAARLKTIGCAAVTETRTDWHNAGDFDAAIPASEDQADANKAEEEDLEFFKILRQTMRSSGGNVWLPELGSVEDKRAERLVKRDWLRRAPGGGYIIVRTR
jgi:predicted nucleotide-binding protein